MDSPLNSAHINARKAEKLVKSGKYDEAIQCHVYATEFILDSMTLTSSSHAQESLKLQHGYHIKKIDKLEDIKHKIERNHSKRSLKGDNCVNKECQTDNIETNITEALSDIVDAPVPVFENVFQTLNETDTLLNFLDRRSSCFAATSGIPAKKHQRINSTFTRKPKDSQTVIEELTIHNDNLRGHIEQLLNEIDQLKKERENLKQNLNKSGERTLVSDMSETHFAQEDFYDLPPLEMPTLGPEFFAETAKEFDLSCTTTGSKSKCEEDSLTCT